MLHSKRLFIFDMDGVLYRTNEPIQSGILAVSKLREMGKKIAFLTNNSSKTPEDYLQILQKMELKCDLHEIFTSALITAQNLCTQYKAAKVYVIGEQGIYAALEEVGFTILNKKFPELDHCKRIPEDIHADLVVVGWDTQVHYGKFRTAMMFILKGAKFYATNDDASFPAPGTYWPGSGANVAFLSAALNMPPVQIFGKPFPAGIKNILNSYNIDVKEAVLIGDRISTDIVGGNRAGIETVFVETGINHRSDLENLPEDHQPTYIFPTLTQMIDSF